MNDYQLTRTDICLKKKIKQNTVIYSEKNLTKYISYSRQTQMVGYVYSSCPGPKLEQYKERRRKLHTDVRLYKHIYYAKYIAVI